MTAEATNPPAVIPTDARVSWLHQAGHAQQPLVLSTLRCQDKQLTWKVVI